MDKKKYLIKTQLNNLIYRQDIIEASCDAEAKDISRKMVECYSEDGWTVTNMNVRVIHVV